MTTPSARGIAVVDLAGEQWAERLLADVAERLAVIPPEYRATARAEVSVVYEGPETAEMRWRSRVVPD